jgi:uncharacterized Zn-binding protein involved in type VI secretion
VYARGVPVLTQGTRINTVDGDAGKGVASGCSKGHTIVLSGSNTVFTNGKPTAFHLSKVCMNCNGADVPNTTGELRTTAVAPKPQWGTKDKGQELKDQNKANNEALHNNPNGKTQEEARALQSKVNQTFADATRHEKAAMDALRSGGGVDVYAESIQTSTNARNMLAEAERQVRFANPTSKAMAEVLVSQLPGSGLVDAGKDFAQAGQQAGQGNYLSAAGSAVMGVFGVVTEAPGLKQIKGVFKGGKAIDKLGDAKKAADLKKAQDAEQARQSGVVIRMRQHKVPCFHPFDKAKFGKMSPEQQKEYLKEMSKQLTRQQDAINGLSAIEYKAARDTFTAAGRNPVANAAQGSYRKDFGESITRSMADSLQKGGMGPAKAEAQAASQAKEVMSKLAALHEPDMVAGGWANPDPTGMGRADVNSSIGGSWNQEGRVSGMDAAADDAIKNGRGAEKMDVKLEPCRGKGMK